MTTPTLTKRHTPTGRIMLAIAVLLGLLATGNGLFMLLAPADWYFAIPGVTSTGAFNQHFVRDIGLVYLFVGIGLLLGAARREGRTFLWSAAALWLAAHACFHLWEVAVGICGPSALARDFPAVSLPAIVTLGLAGWSIAQRRGAD